MATFWWVLAASAVLIGVAVTAMAVGVMARGRCLRGSCGGPEVRLGDGRRISCADCPNRR